MFKSKQIMMPRDLEGNEHTHCIQNDSNRGRPKGNINDKGTLNARTKFLWFGIHVHCDWTIMPFTFLVLLSCASLCIFFLNYLSPLKPPCCLGGGTKPARPFPSVQSLFHFTCKSAHDPNGEWRWVMNARAMLSSHSDMQDKSWGHTKNILPMQTQHKGN